jgi:arylsulfatase A-like enzyme
MMPTPPRRPNVVVFFTDQQRWDCSSLHGNPLELMPTFDRLASRGTHVRHSFTCQPVCGPARSCLQTGQYATKTGVWRNELSLKPDAVTLAQRFAAAGYRTGYIGKWHLGDPKNWGAVPKEYRGGYEDWLAANALELISRPYATTLFDNENQLVRLPGYRVDAITDAAIRYIDRMKDEPFFLFVSHVEPHHQNDLGDYPPPDGYRERYTGRWIPPDLAALGGSAHQHLGGYWGMVKRIDESLARLMDALKSLHLDDSTIVLFTSDHGSHFKTRNSEYKRSCHDSSIRVPTAFWGPGFNGGGTIDELVSLVDLPPTLLDSVGIDIPPSMQGRSILPLLGGRRRSDWPEEVFVQISESQVGRCVRTHRWKYAVEARERNGNKESSSDQYTETALYDLECDPYELTNLIGLQATARVAEVMRSRLLRRMTEAGETPPQIELAPSKPSGQWTVFDFEVDE